MNELDESLRELHIKSEQAMTRKSRLPRWEARINEKKREREGFDGLKERGKAEMREDIDEAEGASWDPVVSPLLERKII